MARANFGSKLLRWEPIPDPRRKIEEIQRISQVPCAFSSRKARNTTPYQQQALTTVEILIMSGLKDSNEILLLNLTKKMEEMAVNMVKDKEKRQKSTNTRTNVWCGNLRQRDDQDHDAVHGLNEPISILRLQQTKEPNLVPRANWSGPSNPGPAMDFVPSMRLDSVAQPNEVLITEASVSFQAILITMQFQETSYPLKDPLQGGNSKEA
uniref:Predicted protein n=1 Tax=Physcomitrium patens TaxID=3218 RepID=A9U4P5_PHYPA